jgi:methionine synthase II (cobalamin-independent)
MNSAKGRWGPFELSEYIASAEEFAERKMISIASHEKRVAGPAELYKLFVKALEEDPRVPKPPPQWLLEEIEKAIRRTQRRLRKEIAEQIEIDRVLEAEELEEEEEPVEGLEELEEE